MVKIGFDFTKPDRGRTDSKYQILNMFNIYKSICSVGEPRGQPSMQCMDCHLGKTIANLRVTIT